MPANSQKNADTIIIIWAGISGLAAAKELQNTWEKVLVLEAKDKIGGRIDTQVKSGNTYEMGASWIHGDIENPVADILKKEGNTLKPTDFEDMSIYKNTKKSDPKDLSSDFWDFAYWQIETLEKDISIAESLELYTKKYSLSEQEKKYLLFRIKVDIETEFGESIEKISLFSLDQWKEMKWGDKLVLWGYDRVIEYLARDIDIRLNTAVQKVEQSASWVIITDTKWNTFAGTKVLVTVPLWVLKKWFITFKPSLSSEKQQAISSLAMWNLHKTFLVFEKSFWDDTTTIDILDSKKDNTSLWGEFINLEKLSWKPVLLALQWWEAANEIEKKDAKTIKKEVTQILQDIYPDVSPPLEVITSSWHKDNYTLWSYSYLPVWVDVIVYELLAKSEGRVYFAWEHTNADFPSTTHGAYLSWIRAAKEILWEK